MAEMYNYLSSKAPMGGTGGPSADGWLGKDGAKEGKKR